MSNYTDKLFMELFEQIEHRCTEQERVARLLREAAGGTWHENEFEFGWTTSLVYALEELERRELLRLPDVEPP